MQVIISGANRVEICKVKKKSDFDRRFFMTRGQLYFVPTDALVRMQVTEWGKKRASEAVVIYKENEIVPYDLCDIDWGMDNMLADIERYKQMSNYGWFNKGKPWFVNVGESIFKRIIADPAMAIVAGVLLWLFLSGGIKI